MAITLLVGVTTYNLPDDLLWQDEFNWTPVSQSIDVTLGNKLIIQEAAQEGGRPMTLAAPDTKSGWFARALLLQLLATAQTAAQQMTLTLHTGTTYNVIWRRDQAPIDARPVIGYRDPGDTDQYIVTLRFLQVPV